MSHAYFPEGGVASVVSLMHDGWMVEAAVVGIDGFTGTHVALGAKASSTRILWQVPGPTRRMAVDDFREMMKDTRFADAVLQYVQDMSDQMAQIAGCNRRHPINQRAARWLLMVRDRVENDRFTLTHEFLATMLGVNRPKVTLAAQWLQGKGLITYRRGDVTILDAEGLGATSCECYEVLATAFPGS